jgi:hypothetical protein
MDAGPHGYLNGGHAHADALSVVLTIHGQPFLVDAGSATYTMDAALRDRFRSTAMHNTVVVNDRAQAEPNGPFHWRATTDATPSMWQFSERADYLEGRHTAYAPLAHVRQVLAVPYLGWFVVDHLLGEGPLRACAFWHLHPDWRVEHDGEDGWTARSGAAVAALAASAPLTRNAAFARHSPVYGLILDAPCLSAPVPSRAPASLLTVVTAAPDLLTGLRVRRLNLEHPPGDGWHGGAFEVRTARRTAVLLAAVERQGAPADPSAAPLRAWGVSSVRTNARIALTFSGAGGQSGSVLINGNDLYTHDDLLASSVQEAPVRTAVVR